MKIMKSLLEKFDAWIYARHYSWKRVTSIHSIHLESFEPPDENGMREIHVTFQTQNHFEVMAIYYWDHETFQFYSAGYVKEVLLGNYGFIPNRMIRPFTDQVFRKIRLQLLTEG